VCTSILFASCLFKKALTLQHTATWQDMIYLMIRVIISRCCNATWQCFCDPRRKFVLFQTKETCNLNSGTTTSNHAASAHSSLHIETYWLIYIYICICVCIICTPAHAHPRMCCDLVRKLFICWLSRVRNNGSDHIFVHRTSVCCVTIMGWLRLVGSIRW